MKELACSLPLPLPSDGCPDGFSADGPDRVVCARSRVAKRRPLSAESAQDREITVNELPIRVASQTPENVGRQKIGQHGQSVREGQISNSVGERGPLSARAVSTPTR